MAKVAGRKEEWPLGLGPREAYWPLSLLAASLQVWPLVSSWPGRAFPLLIHSLPSAPRAPLSPAFPLTLLVASSQLSLVDSSLPPWTSKVVVSQIPVLAAPLFPTSIIRWWCTQCHICRSALEGLTPPLSSRLIYPIAHLKTLLDGKLTSHI